MLRPLLLIQVTPLGGKELPSSNHCNTNSSRPEMPAKQCYSKKKTPLIGLPSQGNSMDGSFFLLVFCLCLCAPSGVTEPKNSHVKVWLLFSRAIPHHLTLYSSMRLLRLDCTCSAEHQQLQCRIAAHIGYRFKVNVGNSGRGYTLTIFIQR